MRFVIFSAIALVPFAAAQPHDPDYTRLVKGTDEKDWIFILNDGSSATEGVSNGDYIDATGLLPDGSEFSQSTSHSETITTTMSWNIAGGSTVDFASLSSAFGLERSLAVSSSETETITMTIACDGQRGKVQYQPLFTRFDGKLVQTTLFGPMHHPEGSDGSVYIPEVSDSDRQLANYRFMCEDGSIPQ